MRDWPLEISTEEPTICAWCRQFPMWMCVGCWTLCVVRDFLRFRPQIRSPSLAMDRDRSGKEKPFPLCWTRLGPGQRCEWWGSRGPISAIRPGRRGRCWCPGRGGSSVASGYQSAEWRASQTLGRCTWKTVCPAARLRWSCWLKLRRPGAKGIRDDQRLEGWWLKRGPRRPEEPCPASRPTVQVKALLPRPSHLRKWCRCALERSGWAEQWNACRGTATGVVPACSCGTGLGKWRAVLRRSSCPDSGIQECRWPRRSWWYVPSMISICPIKRKW